MPEPNHNTSRIGGAQPVPDGHSTRTTHGDPGVPETLPSLTWRSVSALAVVTVVLFAGLFLLGWIPEARRRAEAAAIAGESISSKPLVDVVTPRPGPAPELLLPGDLRPNQSTAIQARATGYLKPLPPGIDIGARVKAGQVIAEIDAPDIDAELAQAKASLEQTRATAIRAKADFEYSRSTVERYEAAARDNAVARQDLEDKRNQQAQNEAAMKVAEANIEAAKANVLRLTELQNFKTVTAPFSGIITARGYDAGALITASDASAGRELFHLDETDILRASVNVPQGFVSQLQPGQGVDLLVRNLPGKVFAGKLARLSGAIDPAARTMRGGDRCPQPRRCSRARHVHAGPLPS